MFESTLLQKPTDTQILTALNEMLSMRISQDSRYAEPKLSLKGYLVDTACQILYTSKRPYGIESVVNWTLSL